jgi:alpha-L-fucosidase
MQYAVLTTKHHDGFALWPTRASDFSIARTRYGGDLVREFVEATRAAGLRVGFYFSLCDWHHPDYPAFTDADRPYRFGMAPKPTPEQWGRFQTFLAAQLRELLTEYGPIDLLWFDGGWERTADAWKSFDLVRMIRELQPGIVINDRLPGAGDYDTPEQFVPAEPPPRAWETCMTMNESWAWNPEDPDYKSPRALVHALCGSRGAAAISS